MISTVATTLMTDSSTTPTPLIPPADIQAILDDATTVDGAYSARPIPGGVQLIETATATVVREAYWSEADTYFRNILMNAIRATQEGEQSNG